MDELDLRVYAIVDPEHAGGRSLPELARLLAAGGATLIQLRDKVSGTAAMIESARAIIAALPKSVPLIVNDRVDVAMAADAAGVHLGPEDMDPTEAREKLGPLPFIGTSVKSVEAAQAQPLGIIDYVGIGGVYGTTSKQNTKAPLGPEGLRRIVEVFWQRIGNFPMVGIAGITAKNAEPVIAAGCEGVSVISALSLAPDPEAATRELRAVVDAARVKYAPKIPPVRRQHHH